MNYAAHNFVQNRQAKILSPNLGHNNTQCSPKHIQHDICAAVPSPMTHHWTALDCTGLHWTALQCTLQYFTRKKRNAVQDTLKDIWPDAVRNAGKWSNR